MGARSITYIDPLFFGPLDYPFEKPSKGVKQPVYLFKGVVDGIRNREEIDFFKKELGSNFIVIAVIASDKIRKKRILARGRKDDSKDIKDIEERDRRELGWGLGDVIKYADIRIGNEGSIKEFCDTINEAFQKL